MIRIITPTGIGSGESFSSPASIKDLNNQCVLAGPDGEVWIIADEGEYYLPMLSPGVNTSGNSSTQWNVTTQVGTAGHPVRVCGKSKDGSAMHAVIRSDRVRPYTSYNDMHLKYEGQAVFGCNVDYINWDHFLFRDTGAGAIVIGGSSPHTAVNIDNIIFDNIRRGLWVRSTSGLTNSKFSNLYGIGVSKAFVRYDGTGSGLVLEDFYLDGDRQVDDSFSIGVQVNGDSSSHIHDGVIIRRGILKNFWEVLLYDTWSSSTNYNADTNNPSSHASITDGTKVTYKGRVYRGQTKNNAGHVPDEVGSTWWNVVQETTYDGDDYWNSDGIATERNDTNVLVEDVYVSGCTDGGFDLKSTSTVLRRCVAEDNKRNYRLWSDTTCIDCESYQANKRHAGSGPGTGGSGGAEHVGLFDGGKDAAGNYFTYGVRWIRGLIDTRGSTAAVFNYEPTGGATPAPIFRIDGVHIIVPSTSSTLFGGPSSSYETQNITVQYESQSTLRTADFIAGVPQMLYGLRAIKGSYSGPLIQIQKSSGGDPLDVGATSTGALDTAAIAAYCGTDTGTIITYYDQTGLGRQASKGSAATGHLIYDGSAVITKNGKPAALVTTEASGYTAAIPALTDKLTFLMVGSQSATTTSSAGRFMGLYGTSSGGTDTGSTGRCIGIYRTGTGTTANWASQRLGAPTPTISTSTTANRLDQVITIYDGTNRSLYLNGTQAAQDVSSGQFNTATRLGIGYTGTTFICVPGAYVSEMWFFNDVLNSFDIAELYADHSAYFAVGT